jgi:hypothetical protein
MQPPPDRIAIDVLEVFGLSRPGWWADAGCRDYPTSWWYPAKGDPATRARAICARCNVAADCLADALAAEAGLGRSLRHGIRAGTSPGQRVALERRGRQAA